MQSLRSLFVSFSNFQATQCRHYTRAFWEKNNDYRGLKEHIRNPPKMGGYVRNLRNVSIYLILAKTFISHTKKNSSSRSESSTRDQVNSKG